MKRVAVLVLGLFFLLLPSSLRGSDHADPINLEILESGITDLFAFPDGDKMIVIMNTRRALTIPPPYKLELFEFAIYMDLHTKVSVDESSEKGRSEKLRYGGSIANPEGINPDGTIKIRLMNDATLNKKQTSFQGLKNPEGIRVETGIFDDPFIFPRFFKPRNTIAMILSIPFSSFPAGQQDWLLWGT